MYCCYKFLKGGAEGAPNFYGVLKKCRGASAPLSPHLPTPLLPAMTTVIFSILSRFDFAELPLINDYAIACEGSMCNSNILASLQYVRLVCEELTTGRYSTVNEIPSFASIRELVKH